jgi:hypothetical protein
MSVIRQPTGVVSLSPEDDGWFVTSAPHHWCIIGKQVSSINRLLLALK